MKVNIDVVFFDETMDIGIIVRKYLVISLLAEAIPPEGQYVIDYGKLLGIIEGCTMGSSFIEHIIIESDSF